MSWLKDIGSSVKITVSPTHLSIEIVGTGFSMDEVRKTLDLWKNYGFTDRQKAALGVNGDEGANLDTTPNNQQ